MRTTLQKRTRSMLALFAFTLALGLSLSSTTWAIGDLAGEMPGGHNTLVAADLDQLRSSPFFEPGLEMLFQSSAVGVQLRGLETRLEISVREDISQILAVTDGPPLSAAALANPMGAIESGEIEAAGTTIFIRGRFAADEILKKVAGSDDSGSHVGLDDFDLHRVDERTLAVISGPSSYRRTANRGFSSRSGLDARYTGALSMLGSSKGIYLMTAPNLEADAQALGPDAEFAAVGVEMGSSIRVVVLLTMTAEESAIASEESLAGLRQQAAGNPMLGVFGLRPLVNNLTIAREEKEIILRTSMTNNEARVLLQRIIGYINSTQQMNTPLGAPAETPAPTPSPSVSPDGVEADFN